MAEGIHEREKEMTDDKGAGGGPYKHQYFEKYHDVDCLACLWEEGFADGRKAERERCLEIINRHPDKCGTLEGDDCLEVIKGELGGQNEK